MTTPDMTLRRPQTDDPTGVGWYYGRYYLSDPTDQPVPKHVQLSHDSGAPRLMVVVSSTDIYNLEDYAWFGPVPACVESGT